MCFIWLYCSLSWQWIRHLRFRSPLFANIHDVVYSKPRDLWSALFFKLCTWSLSVCVNVRSKSCFLVGRVSRRVIAVSCAYTKVQVAIIATGFVLLCSFIPALPCKQNCWYELWLVHGLSRYKDHEKQESRDADAGLHLIPYYGHYSLRSV